MKNVLILCNTVYQIIVATWIQRCFFKKDKIDIIISDHMNNGKEIAKHIRETKKFNNVYYLETFNYARGINKFYRFICPKIVCKNIFIPFKDKYDVLLVSNMDYFSQLLYKFNVKKDGQVYWYEDGSASYSAACEKYYIRKDIFVKKKIYRNVEGLFLFTPEHLCWKPNFKKIKIPAISKENIEYRNMLNQIFQFEKSKDKYDVKYIFFEESYSSEGFKIDDVELVEKIAKKVGKDNIMIKIHPRNPINRFKERGFKTNTNTEIPWELIVMNNDLSDKVLLTVSSTSVLNPYLLFGDKAKAYILYDCLESKPQLLEGDLWNCVYNRIKHCGENIKICKSIDEIV